MYTVVRCSSCERCWGIKGKTRKCPHCGTLAGDKLQIVSVAENASDLQREVANEIIQQSNLHQYKLFMTNSGAESNENALQVASFYN